MAFLIIYLKGEMMIKPEQAIEAKLYLAANEVLIYPSQVEAFEEADKIKAQFIQENGRDAWDELNEYSLKK